MGTVVEHAVAALARRETHTLFADGIRGPGLFIPVLEQVQPHLLREVFPVVRVCGEVCCGYVDVRLEALPTQVAFFFRRRSSRAACRLQRRCLAW